MVTSPGEPKSEGNPELKLRVPRDLIGWVRAMGGQRFVLEILRKERERKMTSILDLTSKELQQRMGQESTVSEAENLREILTSSKYAECECVEDIPEAEWLLLLNRAAV